MPRNKSLASALLCFLMLFGFAFGKAWNTAGQERSNSHEEYVGTYENGPENVLYVTTRSGRLLVRPIFWTSIQPLAERNRDHFVVTDRPERTLAFTREASGKIQQVRAEGFGEATGSFRKLRQAERSPVELLFENKGVEAYEGLSRSPACTYKTLLTVGEMIFERFPSRRSAAVRYLESFVHDYPDSAVVQTLLGRAYVALGKREQARRSFQRASELQPGDEATNRYCYRLGVRQIPAELEEAKWKLPFPLSALFKKPSQDEIDEVAAQWRTRDLSATDVTEVDRIRMTFGNVEAVVRIVSHRVHGFLHYGAIIVPAGATKKSCSAILEAKGVSWNYFPLDLERGLTLPQILGPDHLHAILLLPSYRGERMIVNGREYVSEGDRTDNWDGATDDALALLNVALATTPEIDPDKLGVFGRSRGGSVALLAGMRDKRIKAVVDWSGPTEWFELMAGEGWSQRELVEEGLRIHARPFETAGQFIERFLQKAIEGTMNLKETRLKMIASSPLYFASSLPGVQVHHGIEDRSVPLVNGRALADSLTKAGRMGNDDGVYFYEGFGHDTDVLLASERSREFFRKTLFSKR